MIDERIAKAKQLRVAGVSIKTIARTVGAAQSSVSLWVRDVPLSDELKLALQGNMHSAESIEKRRQSRLMSEAAKRSKIINGAKEEIKHLNGRELWLIGVALYWAEGGKTQSVVRFSNGDPKMVQLMMKFFIEVCNVKQDKIRGHIHIHESLDVGTAEKYWQKITGIKPGHFYKTYNKPNRSSKNKRNSLPYGVCDIYISDAKLLYTLRGWAEGIYGSSMKPTLCS